MIHAAAPAGAWVFEPGVVLGLAASAALYGAGIRRVWRRAGHGHGVARWRIAAFAGGWLATFVALGSPLDPLADQLFSIHMTQHLLLLVVAAPLFALSAPFYVTGWAFPRRWRVEASRRWSRAGWPERVVGTLANPFVAFGMHSAALWAWHLPALYDLAVRNDAVHALEHTFFLATGALFWWTLVTPARSRRADYGVGLLLAFAAAMESSALGALLTFSNRPWYTAHLATTARWGMTPLEDQQLAGLIMWVPPSVIYLAAVAGFLFAWLQAAERRTRAAEAAARAASAAPAS